MIVGNKRYILTFVLLVLNWSCTKVFSQQVYPIAGFKFSSIFGTKVDGADDGIYCLLGNNFFRTESSDNVDKLIDEWLAKHPMAQLIPIAESVSTDDTGVFDKFTYCWITSPSDTLNLHLVRNGAFPGQTMIRARGEHTKMLISTDDYNMFLQRVKEEEKRAFDEKVGVWNSFKD